MTRKLYISDDLSPVPCRGFQGFWTLPDDVARRVTEQIA